MKAYWRFKNRNQTHTTHIRNFIGDATLCGLASDSILIMDGTEFIKEQATGTSDCKECQNALKFFKGIA